MHMLAQPLSCDVTSTFRGRGGAGGGVHELICVGSDYANFAVHGILAVRLMADVGGLKGALARLLTALDKRADEGAGHRCGGGHLLAAKMHEGGLAVSF